MLPRELFEHSTGEQQIKDEGGDKFEVDRIEFDNGVQVYIKGADFPLKTWVSGETMFAVNQVKSLLIESIKIISRKQFILPVIYTFFNKKELNKVLQSINWQSYRVLSPFILKHHYLTRFSQELHFTVFTFMLELGLEEKQADIFAKIISHVIEYDSAYRNRLMDILSETDKNKLQKPIKEIKRLFGLFKEREGDSILEKYTSFLSVLLLALYIPRIRKAFKTTIQTINLENLQLQDSDKYWLCMIPNYNYMGMTYEERMDFFKEKGWKRPNNLI